MFCSFSQHFLKSYMYCSTLGGAIFTTSVKYLELTSKQNSIWWKWAFEHRFKMTFTVEPYQFSSIFGHTFQQCLLPTLASFKCDQKHGDPKIMQVIAKIFIQFLIFKIWHFWTLALILPPQKWICILFRSCRIRGVISHWHP